MEAGTDLSVAIRQLEEAEAELRAANTRAADALDDYEAVRQRCAALGLKVDLSIPAPLGLAAEQWFERRDRETAQERVVALEEARARPVEARGRRQRKAS